MRSDKEDAHQAVLASYCQVCFIPFDKAVPRKLDEGLEVLHCVKCKCHVHRCCYDMEARSTFISAKLREFVCQRCEKKETVNKACFVCHKKDGAMKVLEGNQVVHVFCALTHNEIQTVSYYPQLSFRKSKNYVASSSKCGICSKANANENCAMESCQKKFHGYCVWTTLKAKQLEEDEPQCEKFYFQSGDCGEFDLSQEIMPKPWVYEEFDRVLGSFEQYGFMVRDRDRIKEEVYLGYEKQEMEERKETQKTVLKRGGFAYVLCREHERSIYCNCMDRGSGDMVQCECCFEWYHQKCVNYSPKSENEQYVCLYCVSFYDIKKKIIQEIKGPKIQHYELKFDTPKLNLMDFMWLLRVIDHRISGGLASKMVKELAKYPLKTSKMEMVVKSQNRKKLTNLTEEFVGKYVESEEHKGLIRPRTVLELDESQRPIAVRESIQFNKKLRDYVEFLQNFARKNNLKENFGSVLQELKFKQRVIQESQCYESMVELSKCTQGYGEVPLLQLKVQAYSFMQVIKDIDSGSEISFEDLEMAVMRANKCANMPDYLLKPLIQRYDKVKNLVQLVSTNIHQKKEATPETETAIKALAKENISPPPVYLAFLADRKLIKQLYLLYLKQEGKPLAESLEITHQIQFLARQPPCKPNRELADLIFSYSSHSNHVYPQMPQVIKKYTKVCVSYELKEQLKKKSIKLSCLNDLSDKYSSFKNGDGSEMTEEKDEEIEKLVQKWSSIKALWVQTNKDYLLTIGELDDFEKISDFLKSYESCLNDLKDLPTKISDENEEVPLIGSIKEMEHKKGVLETLLVLYTESQLAKNPFTIHKLPEGMPMANPIVKSFLQLKKQYNELMHKFNKFYERIRQKQEALKDQKRPRKELIKDNLEKPSMSQFIDFIEILKNSRISMEKQIKELTNTVNKSIQIASKVKKFLSDEKYSESLFNEKQIEDVKKEISDLRKKVLQESELCLDSEFKDLYQAEICVRMQHMIIQPNADLDKMGKLLKFAEEEGLNHLPSYLRLKSTFEIGHQSTQELNQIKRHEQLLATEAARQNKDKHGDLLCSGLLKARRSLTLGMPKATKQKNPRVQSLLERNNFLKNKLSLFLMMDPKKYEIDEVRSTYIEALKNPFEVEGLNKFIAEMEKADKVIRSWRNTKDYQLASDNVLSDYEELIFTIEEIEIARKSIRECDKVCRQIERLKEDECGSDGLEAVEDIIDKMEKGNVSKNSQLYLNMKKEYFCFWVKYIQKCHDSMESTVPYNKIRSLTVEVYTLLQKSIKFQLNYSGLRSIVQYLEGILVKIANHFELNDQYLQDVETKVGCIDVEELKYETLDGLNVKQEIKPLYPFRDLSQFNFADLSQALMKAPEHIDDTAPVKRQRSENFGSDPHLQEALHSRPQKKKQGMMKASGNKYQDSSSGENSQDNKKAAVISTANKKKEEVSNNVTDRERFKIKQILLRNMKKNAEFANYEDLAEQVRLIQNQLFGEYYLNIVKYLEMSDLFEKLFIKLINYPVLSSRIVKKKFQWSFLKLLIENKDNFADMEKILIEKSKETGQPLSSAARTKSDKAKETKAQQEEQNKEKNVFQMIASGKLDEAERKQMKKEIKAIKQKEREREKKKKKHRSSRRRSRSRSRSRDRSPDAKFSSDSEDENLPNYIQKQYGGENNAERMAAQSPYRFETQSYGRSSVGILPPSSTFVPLMFNPDEEDSGQQASSSKKQTHYPRGTLLSLKKIDIEFSFKKKGKICLKDVSMMTSEDHQKILKELVDPAFPSPLIIRKDKNDQDIIQYLAKSPLSSRKKYKFLVGWFESVSWGEGNEMEDENKQEDNKGKQGQDDEKRVQQNESIRDFAAETNSRQKIYGIQNEHIKMHIMSIKQYVRILNPALGSAAFAEPPQFVTSQRNAEILKDDRLMFVIQYPAEKMYELKGIYQNFDKVEAPDCERPVEGGLKQFGYAVNIPTLPAHVYQGGYDPNSYLPQGHNPYMIPPPAHFHPLPNPYEIQHQPLQHARAQNDQQVKTIEYEGWETQGQDQTSIAQSYASSSNYMSGSKGHAYTENLNSLNRFSPIMTDEEEGNAEADEKNIKPNPTGIQETFIHSRAKDNDDIGDFASDILNSLASKDFQPPVPPGRAEIHQPPIHSYQPQPPGRNMPPLNNRYGGMPTNTPVPYGQQPPPQQRWAPQGQYVPPPGPPGRMVYNPMAVGQRGPMVPPMFGKPNPMMGGSAPYYPPPPPPPGQNNQYGSGQGGYHRQ